MSISSPEYLMTDPAVEPAEANSPSAATTARKTRTPLEPKRARRRERLLELLTDPYILAEDAEQLTFEANRIQEAFQPRNAWQDWLTSAIATLMFRISRCDRIERKVRDFASFRAIDLWAEDQTLEVESLALRLPRQPARVVAQLRGTPTGIDWLIARWESLARVEPAVWSDPQRDLACLLVGGNAAIDPTEPGFARARIHELRDLYGQIEHADAITRSLVEADLCDDKVAGLARLRRYARSLHRQMKWYIDQFHVEHPDRWDDPRRQPGTIGYDLLDQQRNRPTTWTFAEPHPATPSATRIDETNPFPNLTPDLPREHSATRIDETNPFVAEPLPCQPEPTRRPAAIAPVPSAPRQPERSGSRLPTHLVPVQAAGRAKSPVVEQPASSQSTRLDPAIPALDYSNERGRHHSRALQPGERSRAYERRQQAARRETNLRLIELGAEFSIDP